MLLPGSAYNEPQSHLFSWWEDQQEWDTGHYFSCDWNKLVLLVDCIGCFFRFRSHRRMESLAGWQCTCTMSLRNGLSLLPADSSLTKDVDSCKTCLNFFSKTKHLTSLHSAPHNVNTCVWMRRCITPLCRVSCDTYSEWWFKMLRLCTYCMIYAVLSMLRRLHLSLPSFLDVSHLDTWRSAQRRRSGCKRLGRLKHQFEFLWNSWTMVVDVKHGPIWSLRRSWLLTLDPGASQVKWSSLCRFQQSIQSCGNWCRAASWHVLT